MLTIDFDEFDVLLLVGVHTVRVHSPARGIALGDMGDAGFLDFVLTVLVVPRAP